MSLEFLAPIAPIHEPSLAPLAPPPALDVPASGGAFGGMVSDGLRQVGSQLQATQVDLQRLASGDVENLHQIMIRLEETRLSFQLMMQVRNRLLESYQEVMRMQV